MLHARGSAAPGLDYGDEQEKERDENRPNRTRIRRQPHCKPANQGGARRTRGIRFSDSEWEEVKAAVELHDVPVAEFVRKGILDVARGCAHATPASLAPLIERSFRYTYMLVTHKRDKLIREGHGEDMKKLANDAQKLQDQLQGGASG